MNALTMSQTGWSFWKRWVLAMTAGECAGFAIPAAVGMVAYVLRFPDWILFSLLIVAGILEGTVLGIAQWLILRHVIPTVPRRAWVLATALAAGFAWMLGLLASTVGSRLLDHVWLLVSGGIVLSSLFLVSMGGAQWLVLRHHIAGAERWIIASAIAWPLGVAVPVAALSLIPDGAPAAVLGVVGVFSGIGMGAVVGALTGFALVHMVYPRATVLNRP
jgi:hypothetical protein